MKLVLLHFLHHLTTKYGENVNAVMRMKFVLEHQHLSFSDYFDDGLNKDEF